MTAGGPLGYTYDVGACWEHESRWKRRSRGITARFTPSAGVPGGSPRRVLVRSGVRGTRTFGMWEFNRRLAVHGREPE